MRIEKITKNDKVTLAIEGWLDTQTAPEFAEELAMLDENVTELELDLADLEYVSSAGIRQMVAAYKKMGGKLVLCNVSPEVREVLRLTGTDKRLTILENE